MSLLAPSNIRVDATFMVKNLLQNLSGAFLEWLDEDGEKKAVE